MAKREGIDFFGEIDFIKGKKASTFPAYYFEGLIREFEDRISVNKKKLLMGQVPQENIPQFKASIERDEHKLSEIKESKPHLSQAEQDMCYKVYKTFGSKISEQMPSRSDMKNGTTDAHIEAKRMKEPCISLDNDMKKVAKDMGVIMTAGKVSRDGASKIFKIVGKLLNEPTNIEVLRRDYATNTYKLEHDSVSEQMR